MSTWSTESFRGEHLQTAASISGATWEGWKRFVGLTSVSFSGGAGIGYRWCSNGPRAETVHYPLGEARDLLTSDSEYGHAFRDIFWEWPRRKKFRRRGLDEWPLLEDLMDKYGDFEWQVGLKAVTTIASDAGHYFREVDDAAARYVLSFTKETMVGLCEAARYTTEVGARQFEEVDSHAVAVFATLRLHAESARNVYRMRFTAGRRTQSFATPVKNKYLDRHTRLYYIGGLTILIRDKTVFVLTTADTDRIQQCIVSRAMLNLYLATVSVGGNFPYQALKHAVRCEEEIMWDVCKASSYEDLQRVCKYYKKGMDLYQSYLAGDLSADRRIELTNDVLAGPPTFDAIAYVIRLRKRPLEIAQESGKIYRLLCAPDYDIGEAFLKRSVQLQNPNPRGGHVHPTVPLDMNGLRQYHAALILDAACRLNGNKGVGRPRDAAAPPGWWAKWVEQGVRPRGTNWVDEFEWSGAVPYYKRDATDPDVWKDSTTCEEDWKEVMSDTENRDTCPRNMLTRLLRDDDCPMPENCANEIHREYHVLRAGFKMEAHKDVARIFYIGNLSDRLYGSEIENNISRVGKHVSGYTVGAKIADVVTRVGRCYAPHTLASREVYHISSDYEAWSPGMHGDVQRMSHANWAKIFGIPSLQNQRHINEYSWLLLNKRGYKGATANLEANYEGLNGKEMTILHCAIVGYTIQRSKVAGLDIPLVDFAAFIDDGALTLVLPRETGRETFRMFWAYYEETTAFFGFKLDKAKCYLSNRFLIYLNEVYYGGRHIAHGLRAVMRIGTRDAKRGETILDILGAAGAGCRGASKCGLNSVQIWKCCILVHAIEVYIRYREKYLTARAAVFFTYAPRVLGGLQAPLGLTLDCNFSGPGSIEAMAHIKTYTKYNEEVRTWFLKLIRNPVRAGSGSGLIQNHRTVLPAGPQLRSDYVGNAMRQVLGDYVTSVFGARLISYAKVDDAKDIGEALLANTAATSATILGVLGESLISGVFNAFVRKFNSSGTVGKILGGRRLRELEASIRGDEEVYIRHFRQRVMA